MCPSITHWSSMPPMPTRVMNGVAVARYKYMPPTTHVTDESWPCLFLFRGEPVEGINHYQDLPKSLAGEHIPFRGCEEWA